MISGTTEVVVIAGQPVRQVKSPQNFNSWFKAQGQDTAMVPMDIAPGSVEAFVQLVRGWGNLRGVVVTVPHKQAFARLCDQLSKRASALGAANVVRREADGRLVGDMVDGFGFLGAARDHGFDSEGRSALVVGAGGVGSAIAYALCEAGVARLDLMDVDAARLQALARVLRHHFPKTVLGLGCDTLAGHDLMVNATPIGMGDSGALPLNPTLLESLRSETLVADVVTSPDITPLLAFAHVRGCRIQKGAEMATAQLEFLGGFMGVMPSANPEALLQIFTGDQP